MTPESSALFGILLDSSLRMIAVAVGVGSILTVARVRSAGVRHAAWTAVLVSMLLMPILPQVIPAVGIPIPVARTSRRARAGSRVRADAGATALGGRRGGVGVADALPCLRPWRRLQRRNPAAATRRFRTACALGARGVDALRSGRALLRCASRNGLAPHAAPGIRLTTSGPPSEARAADAVPGPPAATLPRAVSRARIVESSAVATPLTTGILSPVVILPDNWREWPEEKLRAVLAHEFAHVGRRDPLVALVACLNRAVFWFHPLAWWLARTLAASAEDACDDMAVKEAGTARRYAEVLLDMAERVRRQGGRVAWQGVGVDGTGFLGQRIDRILTGGVLRRCPWSARSSWHSDAHRHPARHGVPARAGRDRAAAEARSQGH